MNQALEGFPRALLEVALIGTLDDLMRADRESDYAKRYGLVLAAVDGAHQLGYPAGFAYDHSVSDDPELEGRRIVAYIELPTGQVSWHMPEYATPWDGHTTEQKNARIVNFIEGGRS
jgi:hypothetical protein